MLKKVSLVIIFLLCFGLFTTNVFAKVAPTGNCFYYLKGEKYDEASGQKKDFVASIMITQVVTNQSFAGGSSNVVTTTYHYALGKEITDPKSNEWHGENDNYEFFNDDDMSSFWDLKDNFYTSCPKYVWHADFGDSIRNYFTNKMPSSANLDVDNFVYAKLDEVNSKLVLKNDDYESKACPTTSSWLFEIPSDIEENEAYCLYMGAVKNVGCAIIQLHYKDNKLVDDKVQKTNFSEKWSGSPWNKNKDEIYVSDDVKTIYNNSCPGYLGLGVGGCNGDQPISWDNEMDVQNYSRWAVNDTVGLFKTSYGNLSITNESCSSANSFKFTVYPIILAKSIPANSEIIFDDVVKKFGGCEDLLNDDMIKLLHNVVLILRIMIPILLNVFGIIDFGKAIFAGEEDEMKKAQAKFIKRLIIGVAIFLIPTVLQLILNIANSIWPVVDSSLCGILS